IYVVLHVKFYAALGYETTQSQVMSADKLLVQFFFFSSRRRHTISKRDWSSDVCSSDLRRHPVRDAGHDGRQGVGVPQRAVAHRRSEERRVGKECRARWSPYQNKKTKRQTKETRG